MLLVLAAAFVGVGLALAWRQGDAGVVRRLEAAPADEVEHARLHNVVEGLCLAAGVPKPSLYVLDDPAPNSLVAGVEPSRSSLVVTTGLLDSMTRIELEGVIAHQLVRIKNKELVRSTFAANLPGPLGFVARSTTPSPTVTDMVAVSLTRYPPGLVTALEKMDRSATAVGGASPGVDDLWLVPPGAALDERIDVLREL